MKYDEMEPNEWEPNEWIDPIQTYTNNGYQGGFKFYLGVCYTMYSTRA